jgi:hypothetical protein
VATFPGMMLHHPSMFGGCGTFKVATFPGMMLHHPRILECAWSHCCGPPAVAPRAQGWRGDRRDDVRWLGGEVQQRVRRSFRSVCHRRASGCTPSRRNEMEGHASRRSRGALQGFEQAALCWAHHLHGHVSRCSPPQSPTIYLMCWAFDLIIIFGICAM